MSNDTGRTSILLASVLASSVLIAAVEGESTQRRAAPSAFAKTNLHAWAFEEYDVVSRSPAERAQVLESRHATHLRYRILK